MYMSPLDLMRNNDALLALLWRYRGKMDFYVVNCLNILLEIIVGSPFLSEYMFNLDPPTYEFARFTDWFRPYLGKELEKAQKNSTYKQSSKKGESIMKSFDFLEKYEQSLNAYENNLRGLPVDHKEEVKQSADYQDEDKVVNAYPKRYIVNCVTNMTKISQEHRDGFIVTLYSLRVQYADSQPTLTGNKTLPSYAFFNAKDEADTYDMKFKQANGLEVNDRYTDDKIANWITPQDQIMNQYNDKTEENQGVSQVEVTKKEENEGEDPTVTNEPESDWNLPKKEADAIIIVAIENSNTKSYNFKMKFHCDDDLSKENIRTPVNEIEAITKPLYKDMWMCVHKVDPEKDFGKFHIEWSFKEKKNDNSRSHHDGQMRNMTVFSSF